MTLVRKRSEVHTWYPLNSPCHQLHEDPSSLSLLKTRLFSAKKRHFFTFLFFKYLWSWLNKRQLNPFVACAFRLFRCVVVIEANRESPAPCKRVSEEGGKGGVLGQNLQPDVLIILQPDSTRAVSCRLVTMWSLKAQQGFYSSPCSSGKYWTWESYRRSPFMI